MPNDSEHIKAALHNLDVLKYLLEKPEFCDWSVVLAFYVALHVVDAVIYRNPAAHRLRHGGNHQDRANILKQTKCYEKIARNYIELYRTSKTVRYLEGSITIGFLSNETIRTKFIKGHLTQIIKSCEQFLPDQACQQLNSSLTVICN